MKRVGLMGCGVVATYGHVPAIHETPGVELGAIYDPNPENLRRLHERVPYAQAFTDSTAFFQSGIDAVAVCSPAPVHLQNIREATSYGLPILCEKPLGMTDAEIGEIIQVTNDAGVMLSTAFCYRFSPVALRIRELVAQGVIGEVRALRLIYIWNLHGKFDLDENGQKVLAPRRIGRMVEGGPMVDCGVHQIDLSRWWLQSEVTRYHAEAAWVDTEEFEAPDHMWLHMDHENGAHAAIEMSFSYTHTAAEPLAHFSYHLVGSDGLIRYDRDNWHFEVRTPRGTEYLPGASEKNFTGMYHAWRDALESGTPGELPTGEDGRIVTRIARDATEQVVAARRNRPHGSKR